MSQTKIITEQEFKNALEEKLRLEVYLEHLKKITMDYIKQWHREQERIETQSIWS